MVEYAFRDGYWSKGNPQEVGTELERLRSEHGDLTAELVLDSAKKKASPLHAHFQWDDSKAAHEYRLFQARNLIRSIVVITKEHEQQQIYYHVKTEGRQGKYEHVENLIQNVDLFQLALQGLQSKLTAAADAVQELLEMAENIKHNSKKSHIQQVSKGLSTAIKAVEKISA